MKVALINHGCAKNLVDSELILGLLSKEGYEITLDSNSCNVVIVNTCSFIHDAEKESVQTILQLANEGKKIIVAGCLSQKHKDELKKAIPEISAMIGTSDLNKICDVVNHVASEDNKYLQNISDTPDYTYPENITRQQITVGSSSYIKIAEGCNYNCGYCIIPKLRGAYHSRKIENILSEAQELVSKGVTEIVLIAQDTSYYGVDIYGKPSLSKLLEELNKIEGLGWIRIMYTYPSMMNDELIDAIARLDKVVKYIDIPLQHSDKDVLKSMQRPQMDYIGLIKKIRERIPNIALRTSLIVGYPGETEEQFNNLYEFVKEIKFDRLGVFEYSREENTLSYSMPQQIPDKVKHQRFKKIMKLQQKISYEINQNYVGKVIPCIVEGITDDGVIIMRSEHDAPEVDGLVYAKSDKPVTPGDIEYILINKADEYDLFGTIQ